MTKTLNELTIVEAARARGRGNAGARALDACSGLFNPELNAFLKFDDDIIYPKPLMKMILFRRRSR